MNKRYFSLSSKIIIVLILSSVCALLCYGIFRTQVTSYYDFIDNVTDISDKRKDYYKSIRAKAKNMSLYDKKSIKQLIRSHDSYMSVYIYDDTGYYVAGSYAKILTQPVDVSVTPLYMLQTDFEQYVYNLVYTKKVDFKDGEATLEVFDMHMLKYVKYYFYIALLTSLIMFLLPPFLFIRHKVKYIERLNNEVLNMAQGDLYHPITVKGRDELSTLSSEMDHLRMTLQENYQKEAEIEQTHHDLITSLSHDLRTPLTSLRGYLDILSLHRFKNEEQMDKYLARCIDKVEQIKELSNKTFAYSLVFESNSHAQLEPISTEIILSCIEENLEYLELEGFILDKKVSYTKKEVLLDFSMIKRMINNICSNIQKYADKNVEVLVSLDDSFELILKNKKKQNITKVESNKIGLKSVERIVELHYGTSMIHDDKDSFSIHISIPLKSVINS